MANHKLTQAEIDALVAKLKYTKYLCSFGTTTIGPLNGPPKIDADIEVKDTVLYETGTDAQAQVLSKNDAKITVECNDMTTAMTMLSVFKKGDNILQGGTYSRAAALAFTPITDDATAESIVFGRAFLNAGVSPNLQTGDDPNYVTLNFTAKENASGVLFTYQAATV